MTERLAKAIVALDMVRGSGRLLRLYPRSGIREAYVVTIKSLEDEIEMIKACEADDARTARRMGR